MEQENIITGNEQIYPSPFYKDEPGLTIRQYYAGLAMQGLIGQINVHNYNELAEYSVRAADAIISELNKTEKK